MTDRKTPTPPTSYDSWIACTYAIISLFAVIAMHGFSAHTDAPAPELATLAQSAHP